MFRSSSGDSRRVARAFTLTELMIVIVIVAVIAAITFPVITQAKDAALKAECTSNLKQLQAAVSLYRTDFAGQGNIGNAYEMGLPPGFVHLLQYQKLDKDILHCGRTPNEFIPKGVSGYLRAWEAPANDPSGQFAEQLIQYGERKILFKDMNHNDSSVPYHSPYYAHFGLGIDLGGQLYRLHKDGDWSDEEWWH